MVHSRKKQTVRRGISAIKVENSSKRTGQFPSNRHVIIVLKNASGVIRINHLEFALLDHTFLFLTPNQFVRYDNCEFEDGLFFILNDKELDQFFFAKDFLHRFNFFHQVVHPANLTLEKQAFTTLFELATENYWELQKEKGTDDYMVRSLFYLLLADTNHFYCEANELPDAVITSQHVLNIKKALSGQISELYSVNLLSKRLGISRTYLNALSLEFFGVPSIKLIREKRLQEIKKAILYSSKNLTQISKDFEFSNPANFVRFFKRETGVTPLDYRQRFLR